MQALLFNAHIDLYQDVFVAKIFGQSLTDNSHICASILFDDLIDQLSLGNNRLIRYYDCTVMCAPRLRSVYKLIQFLFKFSQVGTSHNRVNLNKK